MAVSVCVNCYLSLPDSSRQETESHELIPGRFELNIALAVSCHFYRAFCLHAYRYVLHPIFEGEYIHRQDDYLIRAQRSRKRRHHHERRFDRGGLLCLPVGSVFAGNHHGSHAAHVHRQPDLMRRSAALQGERPEELHDRVESVVLSRTYRHGFVTSDAEHWRESAAESPYHVIV